MTKKNNKKLIKVLKESENILNGKIQIKKYHSVKELIDDLKK